MSSVKVEKGKGAFEAQDSTCKGPGAGWSLQGSESASKGVWLE